jgi:4-amino-4-deoxy-L-arabinose transferase-like glycosyltransferase
LQTDSKPIKNKPDKDKESGKKPRRLPSAKILNAGVALSCAALLFLYISKNWELYDQIPGGRKLLFGVMGLALVVTGGTRLYQAFGFAQLLKTPLRLWQNVKVRAAVPVIALTLVALVLRLWSINFGLPYLEQVDEWAVADRALHIVQTGNFDPLDYRNPALPDNDRQAFTYPSLYTYLQSGVFAARFLAGVAADKYTGTGGLDALTVKPDFYLWGRILTAILGAGTALLVFLVGSRWYNRRVGLTGGLFLAFFYLHVINSRYITTDAPSAFFAILPFLLILPILKGSEKKWLYLAAGILCGLAIGTKYNNALIILPLVLAHLLGRSPRKWLNWNLPLAGLGTFAGFFISSPFIFFHLPNFLTDIAAIINHYQNSGHPGYEGENNWLFYLQALGQNNLLALWLGLGGIALAFARHLKQDVTLLAFPLISFLQLSSYKVNFTRNLMPVIPFLAIFAAVALVWLVGIALKYLPGTFARYNRFVLAGLSVIVIVFPAMDIATHANLNVQPTARVRATEYIEKNLPAGSKLYIEPFSVELLPRDNYRLEGGSALKYPPEWYAANGFNYLVLSEAYHKESRTTGKDSVKAAYNALIDGPRPAGLQLEQDFQVNGTDKPGARVIILRTTLKAVSRNPQDYQIQRPTDVKLGNDIRLIGADYPDSLQAGGTLNLALYWQANNTPPHNYTVFVHLLDENDKIASQLDLPPLGGTRPTSLWRPGEITRDDYPLPLPANLADGKYRIVVGMYEPPNGARLTLTDGSDSIEVGTVSILKAS